MPDMKALTYLNKMKKYAGCERTSLLKKCARCESINLLKKYARC